MERLTRVPIKLNRAVEGNMGEQTVAIAFGYGQP